MTSSVFTIHLLENGCKVVVSMVNLACGMPTNDLIANDTNSLPKDSCGDYSQFIFHFSNEAAHLLIT